MPDEVIGQASVELLGDDSKFNEVMNRVEARLRALHELAATLPIGAATTPQAPPANTRRTRASAAAEEAAVRAAGGSVQPTLASTKIKTPIEITLDESHIAAQVRKAVEGLKGLKLDIDIAHIQEQLRSLKIPVTAAQAGHIGAVPGANVSPAFQSMSAPISGPRTYSPAVTAAIGRVTGVNAQLFERAIPNLNALMGTNIPVQGTSAQDVATMVHDVLMAVPHQQGNIRSLRGVLQAAARKNPGADTGFISGMYPFIQAFQGSYDWSAGMEAPAAAPRVVTPVVAMAQQAEAAKYQNNEVRQRMINERLAQQSVREEARARALSLQAYGMDDFIGALRTVAPEGGTSRNVGPTGKGKRGGPRGGGTGLTPEGAAAIDVDPNARNQLTPSDLSFRGVDVSWVMNAARQGFLSNLGRTSTGQLVMIPPNPETGGPMIKSGSRGSFDVMGKPQQVTALSGASAARELLRRTLGTGEDVEAFIQTALATGPGKNVAPEFGEFTGVLRGALLHGSKLPAFIPGASTVGPPFRSGGFGHVAVGGTTGRMENAAGEVLYDEFGGIRPPEFLGPVSSAVQQAELKQSNKESRERIARATYGTAEHGPTELTDEEWMKVQRQQALQEQLGKPLRDFDIATMELASYPHLLPRRASMSLGPFAGPGDPRLKDKLEKLRNEGASASRIAAAEENLQFGEGLNTNQGIAFEIFRFFEESGLREAMGMEKVPGTIGALQKKLKGVAPIADTMISATRQKGFQINDLAQIGASAAQTAQDRRVANERGIEFAKILPSESRMQALGSYRDPANQAGQAHLNKSFHQLLAQMREEAAAETDPGTQFAIRDSIDQLRSRGYESLIMKGGGFSSSRRGQQFRGIVEDPAIEAEIARQGAITKFSREVEQQFKDAGGALNLVEAVNANPNIPTSLVEPVIENLRAASRGTGGRTRPIQRLSGDVVTGPMHTRTGAPMYMTDPATGLVSPAMDTHEATGTRFFDRTGPVMMSGDEGIEAAAKSAGQILPGQLMGHIRGANMRQQLESVMAATGMDAGMARAVVIANTPLPVFIAGGNLGGGAAGGGGGGGGRTATPAGAGGGDDGDGEGGSGKPKKLTWQDVSRAIDERIAAQEQRAAPYREVTGPGYRLPAVPGGPLAQSMLTDPSKTGVELERAAEKEQGQRQTLLDREERRAAADRARAQRAMRANERMVLGTATREAELARRTEDPLFEAAQNIIGERIGLPGMVGPLTQEQQALQFSLYPGALRLATTRDRKARQAQAQAARANRSVSAQERASILGGLGIAIPQDEFDPSVFETQGFQESQQRARASIRQARGRLPQRALSTSVVQIVENLFGGLDKPFGKLAEAEQELAQLGQIGGLRGRAAGAVAGTRAQASADIAGIREARRTGRLEEEQKLLLSLRETRTEYGRQIRTLGALQALEKKQATAVEELAKGAVGASDILQNLAAGFAGGIAGGVVTMGVSVVTQGIMAAAEPFARGLVDEIEKATGRGQTAQRVNAGLADVFTQGGFSQTALRSQLVQAGFVSGDLNRMGAGLFPSAMGMAGGIQTGQRFDLLRAEEANRRQQQQMGLPSDVPPIFYRGQGALLSMTGGTLLDEALKFISGGSTRLPYVDIGGQDSIEKLFAGAIEEAGSDNAKLDARINARLAQAGNQARVVSGEVSGSQVEQILTQRGAINTLAALEGRGRTITGVTTPEQLDEVLRVFSQAGVDFKALADVQTKSVEFQNQMFATFQQRDLQLRAGQAQNFLQETANPLLPGGTGIPGGGSRSFLREFSAIQGQVDQFAEGGRSILESFDLPPDLITEYEALGAQLEKLGTEAGTIQATQQMRAYELSVTQARFAVEDLRALTGRGQGSEIGALERENMLMQRRLQLLQFEQAQRRINFGLAIAGFQTVGFTGEERAARLRISRREAAISQEQLDLQRGMFGNQVQIVDQRNVRSLEIATKQLENVVLSFQEGKRLQEIGQLTGAVARRQHQLEGQIATNLQTELQLEQQRIENVRQWADAAQVALRGGRRFKEGADIFDQAMEPIRDWFDNSGQKGTKPTLGNLFAPAGGQGVRVVINVQGSIMGNLDSIAREIEKVLSRSTQIFGFNRP